MASFANKQLDFIWHGLHFPDSLPGRQSYLYAFLVLTIGYATVRKWRGIRLWHVGVAVVFASALMAKSSLFFLAASFKSTVIMPYSATNNMLMITA